MLKLKQVVTSTLSLALTICGSLTLTANAAESSSKKIFLTGNGIATRLHEPALRQISDVSIDFMRIPDTDHIETNSTGTLEDWVFLGTPVYKQHEHLHYLVNNFNKILCEKPVCLSLNEIQEIKKTINEKQVLFRVNYALRFLPALKDIKDFINNNKIKSAKFVCNAGFNKNKPNKAWKSDVTLGGGILYSILPHFVDLSNFILGPTDLLSIAFESTSVTPMDDIQLFAKTLDGIETNIDINLVENFDEFKIEFETADNRVRIFDLINTSENKIDGTKYFNGSLAATSEISPWHISFECLLKRLFEEPEDVRFAKIDDAESVHEVINEILVNTLK